METNRAATDRARDKTKSLGMDWPHVEETRWTCSQEGTGVKPTGEAKERKTPAHLAAYENGRAGDSRSISRGMRQRVLHKIGLGDVF